MRKGYLLTALAAAVLLAASPGTASAQVTITGPADNTVSEGDTATYNVAIQGYIEAGASADTATVTLATPSPDSTPAATEGEAEDLQPNLTQPVSVDVPANAGTEATAFSATGVIRLQTLHDLDAEDDHFTLSFTLDAGGLVDAATGGSAITAAATNPSALMIDDDETQAYTLALDAGQTPTEGTVVNVTLDAVPDLDDSEAAFQLHLDATPAIAALTTPAGGTANLSSSAQTQAVTITPTANDGNRVPDEIMLSAYTGTAGQSTLQATLSITLADLNALPAVRAMVVDDSGTALDPQPTSVEEGSSVMIAVMPVDDDGMAMAAGEALTVALMPTGTADAADYTLVGEFAIGSGMSQSNSLALSAGEDEDVGMETIMFDATVSGVMANGSETSMSTGVLSLDIMDTTEKKIAPKATDADYDMIKAAMAAGAGEDGLNPGESFELMVSDLFTVMEGYTGSYGVSVEGAAVSASASGEMVMVMAEMAGEAMVTVTGTAQMAGSSLMPSQSVSNVASLTFPVEVVDMPLTLTLMAPDNVMDGNVVEGETYDLMVMANRMITEAEGSMEVMIMRDRSQSDADDSDFTVGSAMLMAGSDSATAELMVMEDMMPDAGTNDNMGEQLVLYGMYGDDMETNDLMLTIWDAAVPALPLIGQLVLALFLALGGARLYRRRQG